VLEVLMMLVSIELILFVLLAVVSVLYFPAVVVAVEA
jgi:hypothetical protein